MKIAIIADIHGNLQALEAVLADVERVGADRLIINGDLVNRGPDSVAVMERLDGVPADYTLGNHDDLVVKWHDRSPDLPQSWFDDPFWLAIAWTTERLDEAGWIDRLRRLPMTVRVDLADAPSLLISHGSPRHYREGYGRYLAEEEFGEIVQMHPADLYIGSHTHLPYERSWGRHVLLNTGAVGAPFNGDRRAQYLLLTPGNEGWSWEFRAVEYDHERALASFVESGYLEAGALSARIFHEELKHALPLYAPYWMWAEREGRPLDWSTWEEFYPGALDWLRRRLATRHDGGDDA